MSKDFQPLQVYLNKAYSDLGLTDLAQGARVIEVYKSVVGDLISKLSSSIRYDNHRLYVSIASAALRNEMAYKRQSLVSKINEEIGQPLLHDIIFN
ncbi:MAG: DUF721 domain-containing protein [Bacteroidales bacterium]|nr:DUF721 domain-containing protein [Candidatus Colimorpha onthohippi]